MHFTVLTAVTLPENCGQAINLPATVRINELVAALRRARFGDNAAKDALDSELVETQVRFEQMVEDLVDNRLLPYCENIEDRAYLEFVDCTEECRREYENDGEVMVRLVNGKWLPMYDHQIYNTYEVYEGKVYQRNFGPLHHRKRTKKAKRMKAVYMPFKKAYRSFSTFAEELCGLARGEEPGTYGFYRNPNAKWDWFQIGGRWPDRFLVKADCPMVHTGEVSLLMQDYQGRKAPEGYCWVAGARKKDIAWDVMREQRARAETEYFHKLESWYQNGQIPDDRRGFLSITDEGIRSWNALAYAKGETLEEHLHREGLSQSYCYPISTFACMGDEGWLESGEMGWFGISDNNKDDLSWNQMVEQFVAALPEDAMLLSVDCHI